MEDPAAHTHPGAMSVISRSGTHFEGGIASQSTYGKT